MLKKLGGLMGMLALLLLPAAGWAECSQVAAPAAGACAEEAAIEAYLCAKLPGFSGLVLTFNHQRVDPQTRARAWSWNSKFLTPQTKDAGFVVDFEGKPSWSLDAKQQFLVLVTETNPLVFATEFTEAKEENIADLADLQKIAGLIGGFARGLDIATPLAR